MRIEPVFLFDLDGTLVDSVYQHVLAWKEALDAEGIALSVWRIHRKVGMSGGLFTNQLLRETGTRDQRGACRAAARAPCRSLFETCASGASASRRARIARLAHGCRYSLGNRHQRAYGDGPYHAHAARRRSESCAGRHPRSGEICQARSGSLRRRGGTPRPSDRTCAGRRRQHLGHARRAFDAARSASACSAADMASTSCATPAPSASMTMRATCCIISTRSPAGAEDRGHSRRASQSGHREGAIKPRRALASPGSTQTRKFGDRIEGVVRAESSYPAAIPLSTASPAWPRW